MMCLNTEQMEENKTEHESNEEQLSPSEKTEVMSYFITFKLPFVYLYL